MTRRLWSLLACTALLTGLLIAAATPAQAAIVRTGPATPFVLHAGSRHYCLGTDVSLAIIAPCNGSSNQAWYPVEPYLGDGSFDSMFQQKSTGKCLQVQTGSVNSLLITRTCTDQDSRFTGIQTWFRYGGTGGSGWANTKYYRATHACMGVNTVTSGQAVSMVPCNGSDTKQGWDKES